MLAQHFLAPLTQDAELIQIPQQVRFGQRHFVLSGLTPSAKPAYLALLQRVLKQPLLYVGSDNSNLEDLKGTTGFFHRMLSNRDDGTLATFPALEPGPYSGLSPHAEVLEERALALWRLFQGQLDMLFCPLAALLTLLPDVRPTFSGVPTLSVGQEYPPEELVQYLLKTGYLREEPVSSVGAFSIRGGILDVFPPNTENPVRIEFFGDEIESLREFSVKSQRSIGPVQKLIVPPMREFPLDASQLRAWSEIAEQTLDRSEYADFLETQAVRARNGEPFAGCEFLLPLSIPFEKTLLDFASDFWVVIDEPDELQRWLGAWTSDAQQEFERQLAQGIPAFPPEQTFLGASQLAEVLQLRRVIFLDQLGTESGQSFLPTAPSSRPTVSSGGELKENGVHTYAANSTDRSARPDGDSETSFEPLATDPTARRPQVTPSTLFHIECPTRPVRKYHGNLKELVYDLENRSQKGTMVVFVQSSLGKAERLYDILKEYDVSCVADFGAEAREATLFRQIEHHVPTLVVGDLADGFEVEEKKLVLFGDNDLFDEIDVLTQPGKAKSKAASFISDFRELKPGDYVVHVDHGIGQFLGLKQIVSAGITREFMILNYFGDAKLYVPLERLDLIQKHSSGGGIRPQLDKLGGTTWAKTKARIKRSMRDMAEELLKLYAERRIETGYAFSANGHWHDEFEEAFEFSETSDQLAAIRDVYRDMESDVPMDRLLCGDVGFGKTEVAMRAAFKAAFDGKQVAVLAPTTVLVYQHYLRFKQRFTAFPINVEMLSRFRSPKEQAEIVTGLAAGRIDIIIGTHRMLSKDIQFRDLGLLIVDEEQQFGVAHKERLKQLKTRVDTLTMTATPIPRTLHMSLMGIRDMSVIETPPRDRLAIQTVVVPFSKQVIQNPLQQELARHGQVYFVHNRVESIYSVASMIQKVCPAARVLVAHGQMAEKELETTMLKFVNHEADILVSTTIIENGLDIPLVNTLVVNRADRFGLAQLYQLRGRVGRSSRRAYAYFLIPPDKALHGVARQRLAALKEFSDLGSGFKIAALDLELRGAGNLLGGEQHGHINAIGFDLYCQMLERTIEEMRGAAELPEVQTHINLRVTVKIPEAYITDQNQRLSTYKRISSLKVDSEIEDLRNELEDRYGPPPREVESLMDYVRLRLLAERVLVRSIERERDGVAIKFHEKTPVQPQKLVDLVSGNPEVVLSPNGVLKLQSAGVMPSEIFSSVRGLLLELAG
jgi:transcription-repair coupling factor (superfamily II helicase)